MAATRTDLGGTTLAGWLGAGVLVIGLHAGGVALALMQWPEEDTSFDSPGVVTLELAPLTTSTPLDNPDAAPGPVMQEAPNTPEASKRVDATPPDSIELERAPLAPQPEVTLPVAKPREEKVEDKPPEEKASYDNPTEASVGDPVTRAPPKIEAPVAATTAAPVAGAGREAILAQASWQKSLLSHLNTHKRYPAEARVLGHHGTVKVQFVIDRTGKVTDAQVLTGSGSKSLDQEAIAVLRRASPLPAPPDSMPGDTLSLVLPIQFHIK
jgi:protein TonB